MQQKLARSWVIPLTAVCLVLGALLGVQVHTQSIRGETKVGRQTSALVGMLTAAEARLEEQQQEIKRLRSRLTEYEQLATSERGLAKLMSEELRTYRIALGLVPVEGPGIELELDDSTMRSSDEFGGQDLYVVHDFDLVQVANELWAAGAEAISLNGQRLITGSAITCSARLIRVNNVTIASPFTFLAIGNREKLTSALNIRDGVLDRLRLLQFQVKLTPQQKLEIPPIPFTPEYEYAEPFVEEKKR